jgi:transcriptional regulator with XRE-family HTH domain
MKELAEYLRSRRAVVTPGDVNLVSNGRRRVPGLRREEVALLAGVSVDYYMRLEQGRETSPSAQVLDALASALRLPYDGRLHLFRLAGLAPRTRVATTAHVDPLLRQLLDAWSGQPALIYNRSYDVLASNELAGALFGWQSGQSRDNLMELVFLRPEGRALYRDWDEVARNAVAGFRLGYGADPSDPRIRAVLSRLLGESSSFTQIWSENDARGKQAATKRLVHPDIGPITLQSQIFDVRSAPGQELVVYHAEPGSSSADALGLIGNLAATRRAPSASI